MTKLLETLKFKNISSELTDDEFDVFLRTLHRRKGRELILQLLCQQQAPSVSMDMLQIASSIIQKRENQHQKTSRWTLDTLPIPFIGEIASNLKKKDYDALSCANRATYIGCNVPNRLLQVCISAPPFNLTKYSRLEQLRICDGNLTFSDDDRQIGAHLKYLCLTGYQSNADWTSIVRESAVYNCHDYNIYASNTAPFRLQSLCVPFSQDFI